MSMSGSAIRKAMVDLRRRNFFTVIPGLRLLARTASVDRAIGVPHAAALRRA